MAIDFPSNPTNGQVYANYIYDSSITAWRNVNTDTGIGTLNAMGLKNVVPTSISVGSGSATVNSNGRVTFSSATSLSLNNVFSSTYTSYKIVLSAGAASTGTSISLRLRSSGADRSNSAYYFGGYFSREQGTTTGAWSSSGITSMTLVSVYNIANTNSVQAEINNPFDSSCGTSINWQSWNNDPSGGYGIFAGGLYATQNSNDGLTLVSSGTMTGYISIYGYTN